MTEEKKDYYILTDSKEKFKELEKAYLKFRENYIVSFSGGRLIVRENPHMDKEVSIYPETRSDTIKEITRMESNLEGRLKNGNGDWYSGCWFIELKENKYFIYYKNPDFKN